jgi:alanine racemase
MPNRNRPTWIEVDRDALANNVRKLRRRLTPGTRLMAVVKANAYGHGAVETTRALVRAGADACGVATLGEACELRGGGIEAPLLVLGYVPPAQVRDALSRAITLTVFDYETAAAYAVNAAESGIPLTVHIKVNTGMNRLGVEPADLLPLAKALHKMPSVRVEGIFSHFATSDELDKSHAYRQLDVFRELLAALSAHKLRPPIAHCANSAAILSMPETHFDLARSGIALYGLDPDADECPLPDGFRPALSWKAQVAQVRWLEAGDAVSYGREFIAPHRMPVAVLPVGYADGFPRRPHTWGYVLLGGQPAPILGRVCMDQTVVDASAAFLVNGGVKQGDEAVLIGRQGDRRMIVEEIAARVGTNNYDIVSRLLARVPRQYIGSEK